MSRRIPPKDDPQEVCLTCQHASHTDEWEWRCNHPQSLNDWLPDEPHRYGCGLWQDARNRTCLTCKHWSAPAELSRRTVVAHCPILLKATKKESVCGSWTELKGEPRGVGVSKYWYIGDSTFENAAIIHDLDYDKLKGSSKMIDERFLKNCLKLSKGIADRAMAYFYYGIVRLYGRARKN